MSIDPHAWLLTAPLTIALVQIYIQPREFILKRWWRQMRLVEAETWFRLGRGAWYAEDAGAVRRGGGLFALLVLLFAITTLASFAAFIGVL